MKRLMVGLLVVVAAGAVMGQTFTDLAGNATYEGKTGLKKLGTAIDANFALIESGAIHYSSLTVSNGSNAGEAALILQADKFDNAGDMTAVVGTDGSGIAFQSDASAKGTLATKASIGTDGIINTLVGLDAIGAVDMDYGSADVTDHTFVSDGTGSAEFVIPAGGIDGNEIADGSVSNADLSATAAVAWTKLNTYGQVNTNATAFSPVVEQFLTGATVANMQSSIGLEAYITNSYAGTPTMTNLTVLGTMTAKGTLKADVLNEVGTAGIVVEGVTINDGAITDLDGSITESNVTANGTVTLTPVSANIANAGTLTPVASVYLLNPTGWQGAVQGTNTVYLAAPGAAGKVLHIIVPASASNEVTIAAGATGLWTTPSQLATNDCATFFSVSGTKWARLNAQNN